MGRNTILAHVGRMSLVIRLRLFCQGKDGFSDMLLSYREADMEMSATESTAETLKEDSIVDIAGWRFYTGLVFLHAAAAAPD